MRARLWREKARRSVLRPLAERVVFRIARKEDDRPSFVETRHQAPGSPPSIERDRLLFVSFVSFIWFSRSILCLDLFNERESQSTITLIEKINIQGRSEPLYAYTIDRLMTLESICK